MTQIHNRILLVEDEELIGQALVDKLTREGFEVTWAKNGVSGLEQTAALVPDLILLDIIMPKMDGITMLKKLQADELGRKIPILILTNLSDNRKVEEAMTSGAYDYLVKTEWTLEELVAKMREVLSRVTLFSGHTHHS